MAERIPLGIRDLAKSLCLLLSSQVDDYTGFVLLLYRRRSDGVEEVTAGTSMSHDKEALETCARHMALTASTELPIEDVDVAKIEDAGKAN